MDFRLKYAAFLLAAVAVSCKADPEVDRSPVTEPDGEGREIVLRLSAAATKAGGEAEALPPVLHISMTRGLPAEEVYLPSTPKSVRKGMWDGEGTVETGRHQSAVPTPFNFYVSNMAVSYAESGSFVFADGSDDIICGYMAQCTDENPRIDLRHIFARTGGVTVVSEAGYSVSAVSATIVEAGPLDVTGRSGVYNLREGEWTAAVSRLSESVEYLPGQLLLPGRYSVTLTFTLTKGDFTKTYVKTGSVTLRQGSVNTIVATVFDDEAVGIDLGVSLEPWRTESVELLF